MEGTIIVVSDDDALHYRFVSGVASDERVVHMREHGAFGYPACDPARTVVVIDCRSFGSDDIAEHLDQMRSVFGARIRIVVIVRGPRKLAVELITTIGDSVADVAIQDDDRIIDIVRAQLNDPSGTGAAAHALAALTRFLPKRAHAIPRHMLVSGLRLKLVTSVADEIHEHRGSETRRVNRDEGFTGRELVALTKATFAAALLRISRRAIPQIARLTGYTRTTYMTKLLRQVFDRSARELRADLGTPMVEVWLVDELKASRLREVSRRKERQAKSPAPKQRRRGRGRRRRSHDGH